MDTSVKDGNQQRTEQADRFVAMVTAKAEVDLRLSDYQPVSMLQTPVHCTERPIVQAIDYHNHLDSTDPRDVLAVMDACGIEKVVNITMQTGEDGHAQLRRFAAAAESRFATIGWMDWSDVHAGDFLQRSLDRLERLAELGGVGIKFWKDFGLLVRDSGDNLLRIDDERFAPIFAKAGELGLAVMFHTADPSAFFRPIDAANERYEELAAHPEWGVQYATVTKDDLLDQRDRVFARHPEVTFVGAHVGECGENLQRAAQTLERHSNVFMDFSARTAELGRQPYSARRFFLRFADRIVFGTDLLPDVDMYRGHFRFLETDDEYFEYPSHASRQGRWNIYGLHLPEDVLRKVYRQNAEHLLRMASQA